LRTKARSSVIEKGLVMKMNKAFLWLLLFVVVLVILLVTVRTGSAQEYYQFNDAFSTLPSGQTIILSAGVEMRLDALSVSVTQHGIPKKYLVLLNTCSRIPYELTSVHDNSVAQTDVIVCNIRGGFYYRVPLTS
jgi:hypothetical protein